MKRQRVLLLLFIFITTGLGFAQEEARQAIEAEYQTRYRSAEKKSLYGMRHARAPDFVLALEGEELDLESFYQRWSQRMSAILKARWQGKTLEFKLNDSSHATFLVAERFEAVLRNELQTAVAHLISESVLIDKWEKRQGKWLQVSSGVLKNKQVMSKWKPVSEVEGFLEQL